MEKKKKLFTLLIKRSSHCRTDLGNCAAGRNSGVEGGKDPLYKVNTESVKSCTGKLWKPT